MTAPGGYIFMDQSAESHGIERAWRYYKHADDLQHRRHQLFVTVQAALVAAFVTSVGEQQSVALTAAISGIVLAVFWVALARSVQRGMDGLNEKLRNDPVYEGYLGQVRAVRGVSGRWILNVYLPVVVGLVWFTLLAAHPAVRATWRYGMPSELVAAVLGGLVGGVLGVLGTLVTSYYGPRKMEEWREQRLDERLNGPRRRLLLTMLEDERFNDGRSLDTLARVTGTTQDECRRLLIEIGARGIALAGDKEGWALISRKPLDDL